MRKEKTKKKLLDWMMSEQYYTANLKKKLNIEKHETMEVWTCQRAENLKNKSSKIPKNNYAGKMVSAARRQIIGGGGGGAPIIKSRRRRRSQIVDGGGAARPAHSSSHTHNNSISHTFRIVSQFVIILIFDY